MAISKASLNIPDYTCACPAGGCPTKVTSAGKICGPCSKTCAPQFEQKKKLEFEWAEVIIKERCKNPNGCPWGGTIPDPLVHTGCPKCIMYWKKHGKWPKKADLTANEYFKNNSDEKSFVEFINYASMKSPSLYKKPSSLKKKKKKKRPLRVEQKVWKRIGLNPKLNLKMECADFYLLEKMVAESGWTDSGQFMGNEKILALLHKREEFLSHEFSTYLDMALGGEIRHAAGTRGDSGYKGKRDFSPEMQKYLDTVHGKERDQAWDVWTRLRRRAPKKTLPLLQEAVRIFEGEWVGGAGGKPWAQIGHVALPFIEGKMSMRSFVNLCWSLQHCHNFVFDKTYNVDGLDRVLEAQASGWYDTDRFYGTGSKVRKNGTLLEYASPEVQVLWKRFKTEQHKPQGMDVPDWHGTGD